MTDKQICLECCSDPFEKLVNSCSTGHIDELHWHLCQLFMSLAEIETTIETALVLCHIVEIGIHFSPIAKTNDQNKRDF